jgi:hypothetical protein
VEVVCQTWREAADLYFDANTHTVSVDEMPGLQALERIAETIPMQRGQPKRIEYEYRRHGTLCLIGNWHVVEGHMISPTIKQTRTEEDFAWHIHHAVQTDPNAGWVFVLDNLNVHCSVTLVGYVAELEGIDKSTLGKKGRHGILKWMASRQKFLSDRSHRVRFVYLPKHTSWLNQIEIIFGLVSRRVMRRGNFTSQADLKHRLFDFMEYFNATFAKPFQWNYTGRPVRSDTIKRPSTDLWEPGASNRLGPPGRRPFSPTKTIEVRVHFSARRRVAGVSDVSCASREPVGLLCVAASSGQCSGAASNGSYCGDSSHS